MKVLIATDLLISMLLRKDYVDGMDILFMWLKKLKIEWNMDMSSLIILTHFSETKQLNIFNDFRIIKEAPPVTKNIQTLKSIISNVEPNNVGFKTLLPNLSWLDSGYVDFIITENQTLSELAHRISLDDRVYSIENFIEKCAVENRELDPTKGVIVKEVKMKSLSLNDKFFESFIKDYSPYYFQWFQTKSDDNVYVSKDVHGKVKAILKLKIEESKENYSNITPVFRQAKRLKISSFKVDYTGQKIGERFMQIIFLSALKNKVDEIYVTIFNNSQQKKRLVNLLSDFGFNYYGIKDKDEDVYTRQMIPLPKLNERQNFPFVRYTNSAFIIPIHHDYSKDLLPDIDVYFDKEDIEPYKCSIKKVITLYSDDLRIQEGSIFLFYRMTKEQTDRGIIAVGMVENVYRNVNTKQQYVLRCRKRSILDDERLESCWQRRDANKSLVVADFLYNYSFRKIDITEEKITAYGISLKDIHHQCPVYITRGQYKQIIEGTYYAKNIDFD